MKTFLCVLAVVAVVAADVSHLHHHHSHAEEATAQILRQEADVLPDRFNYVYETSNGIAAQESGQLKNAGREDEAIEVQGSSQYTAPDGTPIQLTYVANEFGFQPQGAHLPTPPPTQPIPPQIARALEWIAAHPQPEERSFASGPVIAASNAFASSNSFGSNAFARRG